MSTTNNLYAKGYNHAGQLGIGKSDDKYEWTLVPFFKDKQIQLISKSKNADHVLIYTKNNKLYGFGENGVSRCLESSHSQGQTPESCLGSSPPPWLARR